MARAGRSGTGLTEGPARPLGAGTLPERIQDVLEEAIVEGRLPPGTPLNSDELATTYGVDRVPVREALRSLHETGWLAVLPRHGVCVRERSRRELDELVEARAVVDAAITRWAAERATDEDLRTLSDLVGRSREAARARHGGRSGGRPGDELEAIGREFGTALRAAARNSVLATTSAELERRARFYLVAVEDHLAADRVEVHEELVALVRARDGRRAAEVAAEHVRDTGRAVSHLLHLHAPVAAPA